MDGESTNEVRLGARAPLNITFDNRGDRLIGLGVWNAMMKLATLGLYGSWAKTEVRRRIWSFVRLNGEPLEYTGTGWELFIGLIVATLIIVVPMMTGAFVIAIAFSGSKEALSVYQLALYVVFFLLIGNAIYRAWRYRLSRTRWRGIRGALTGSPSRYGWTYFWTLALPIVTISGIAGVIAWAVGPNVGGVIMLLGMAAGLWILPWRANLLRRLITKDIHFGDRPLSYDGTPGPLYKAYFVTWLACLAILATAIAATLSVLTAAGITAETFQTPGELPSAKPFLTVAAIWIVAFFASAVIIASYRAKQLQHFAHHTHFEGATFRSEVTGGGLMWLTLSNWLLLALAVVLAIVATGAIIFWTGLLPVSEDFQPEETAIAAGDILRIVVAVALISTFSTIATTFAQFRSARYVMSRLKLDGAIDVGAIAQSQSAAPKRGEGLAQVFDLDAI